MELDQQTHPPPFRHPTVDLVLTLAVAGIPFKMQTTFHSVCFQSGDGGWWVAWDSSMIGWLMAAVWLSLPSCGSHAVTLRGGWFIQKRREREMQQEMLLRDEETMELRETFTSLQQEVEIKTKKLKKVRSWQEFWVGWAAVRVGDEGQGSW